jgi:gliding motility-associated protein GldL
MGLAEITQSTGWKKFMAKLYGIGAAIVIIGALFKIQHWPGASFALTCGLLIEAVIFFFSAFEPLHEELDWTLVYPELAGMSDPDELETAKDQDLTRPNYALERFDDLMGGLGGIDPSLIQSLGDSFSRLNQTADGIAQAAIGLSDMSQASNVTAHYVQNVGAAAESLGHLSLSFQASAAGLQHSADAISQSSSALTSINDSSAGYAYQMESMNKNIAQLNAVYEMQLLTTNEQMQKTAAVYEDMEQILGNIRASAEETLKYREEMANLNRNLSNLNTVYGNMLTAMNVRTQ